jgi:uncharacterized protein (UPF0179 family)
MPSCEKKNQLVHQDGRVDLVDMYCSRASRKHRFCFTTQKTFSCLFVSFCFIRLKAGRAFIIVQLRGAVWLRCYLTVATASASGHLR